MNAAESGVRSPSNSRRVINTRGRPCRPSVTSTTTYTSGATWRGAKGAGQPERVCAGRGPVTDRGVNAHTLPGTKAERASNKRTNGRTNRRRGCSQVARREPKRPSLQTKRERAQPAPLALPGNCAASTRASNGSGPIDYLNPSIKMTFSGWRIFIPRSKIRRFVV